MNNIDEMLRELELMLEKQKKIQQELEEALRQTKINIEETTKNIEKAKEAKILSEEASLKSQEAKRVLESINKDINTENTDTENNQRIFFNKKRNKKKKNKNKGFIKGLLVGAGALSILLGSAKLVKESKTGNIKFFNDKTVSSNNEYTDTNNQEETYTYDYNGNVLTVNDSWFDKLTEEKFNVLVDSKIAECREKGIAFDEEDVEKLVFFTNINRILVDNPKLYSEKMEQYMSKYKGKNLTEDAILTNIMLDGEKIQDTFNSYNCNLYRETKDTKDFILISDIIFDLDEREKAEIVESRVNEIGSYARTDVDKMNELITKHLTSLYENQEEVYNMESGTCYGLRFILRPIRDLYGRNECEDQITLNDENKEFIKYFVSYVEDDFNYYIDGWGTMAYQNVYGILKSGECKTLTK